MRVHWIGSDAIEFDAVASDAARLHCDAAIVIDGLSPAGHCGPLSKLERLMAAGLIEVAADIEVAAVDNRCAHQTVGSVAERIPLRSIPTRDVIDRDAAGALEVSSGINRGAADGDRLDEWKESLRDA